MANTQGLLFLKAETPARRATGGSAVHPVEADGHALASNDELGLISSLKAAGGRASATRPGSYTVGPEPTSTKPSVAEVQFWRTGRSCIAQHLSDKEDRAFSKSFQGFIDLFMQDRFLQAPPQMLCSVEKQTKVPGSQLVRRTAEPTVMAGQIIDDSNFVPKL